MSMLRKGRWTLGVVGRRTLAGTAVGVPEGVRGALVLIGLAAPAPLLAVGAWADTVVQWAVGNERERGHLLRQICGVGQLLLQVSVRLEAWRGSSASTGAPALAVAARTLESLIVCYFTSAIAFGGSGQKVALFLMGWRCAGVERAARCRVGEAGALDL